MKAFCLFGLTLLALALTSTSVAAQSTPPAPAPPPERPLAAIPYTPSLEPSFMDRTVDPCVDFYAYSCNGWIRQNPIPPDQGGWSVYGKLYQENQQFLWGILEQAAKPDAARTPERQKIGDYFASCMDLEAIDRAGLAPIRADLDAIANLGSTAELGALLGRLHAGPSERDLLFGFGANQDLGDATQVIAFAVAGGLGLPDRD